MTQAQFVKKISRGTVFGDKADVLELVLKDREKDWPLYSIGGEVTKIEAVKSKFKQDTEDDPEEPASRDRRIEYKLLGDFKAINQQTGEMFASPICWLPAFAAAMIVGKFREGDIFEFALLIGAKFSETVATSYEFTIRSLMAEQPTPEMQRIENLMMKTMKGEQAALEKPKENDAKNVAKDSTHLGKPA